MRIRRARPDEAAHLTGIAHAAKRHWGYPEPWIRRWRADLTITASFIRRHPVYCAVANRRVVGFYALSRRRTEFELEHMWVDPALMGRGIGKRLFTHALATARAAGGASLCIASDPNAEGFYLRLGARRVGAVPSSPQGRELPVLVLALHAAEVRRPSRKARR